MKPDLIQVHVIKKLLEEYTSFQQIHMKNSLKSALPVAKNI